MDKKDNTLLERGADNDITRLRWRLKICENTIARLVAENERMRNGAAESCETVCPHIRGTVTQHCSLNFTLTDEEREAIEFFADIHCDDDPPHEYAATLRLLLKRL
jgi:hypothetical protein